MSDLCGDNRFELIKKYKQRLIEATNIETAPDEMKVLDTILFRLWQMGWLDKLELPPAQPESLSDAYMKAVWTWLLDYQIKAAELNGRYTPYEVLSWVVNDWRKEYERPDIKAGGD